jgi:hypothetical protein
MDHQQQEQLAAHQQHLDQQTQAHQAAAAALAQQQAEFNAQVAAFQAEQAAALQAAQAAAAQQAQQHPPPPVHPDHNATLFGKALAKPTKYDGQDKAAANIFVASLKLYVQGNVALFAGCTEAQKVTWAITYLTDKAFAWIHPYTINSTAPNAILILQNFDNFCSALLNALGDPNIAHTNLRRLKQLRQTSSATSYRTEFEKLSMYVSWDDESLRSLFYDGLKDAIKDALANLPEEPEDFESFKALCIRIDERHYERKQDGKRSPDKPHKSSNDKSGSGNHSSRQQAYRQPNTSGPAAMDLDASSNNRFKPLTPDERQRRMENNLCLYCGKAGHSARDCPNKKKPKTGHLRATLTGPSDASPAQPKNE